MESNHPYESKIPYFAQILILLGLALMLGSLVAYAGYFLVAKVVELPSLMEITSSSDAYARHPNAFLLLQFLQSIGMFIIPALIFSIIVTAQPLEYFKPKKKLDSQLILTVVGIAYFMGALVSVSSELNQLINFPDALKEIEQWLIQKNEEVQDLYKILLDIDSPTKFLVILIVAAVLPAIGEELIFRGALQGILVKWTRNVHIGIWIAAIIFSAFHLQFYYFLPRLFLGAMFGYLLVWSGNIWYPILAHFLNNAFAVIAIYYYRIRGIEVDMEEIGEFSITVSLIFILILFALLYFFRQKSLSIEVEANE